MINLEFSVSGALNMNPGVLVFFLTVTNSFSKCGEYSECNSFCDYLHVKELCKVLC